MDGRRLADLQVGTTKQCKGSGTGYSISPRLVLTCSHVVVDADRVVWPRIEVRIGHPDAGPPSRRLADLVWVDPPHDLALLAIRGKPHDNHAPVRWGCLIGTEPVEYKGVGLPSFAYYESGRGVEQLSGSLSPLSVGVDGGYVLDQSDSPDPHQRVGWAGISGAAIFRDDMLIGVVIKDDRAYAHRRLHAARAYRLLQSADAVRLLTEDLGYRPVLEAVELRQYLRPPLRPTHAATPGSILAADIEAVQFTGRKEILQELAEWRENPRKFSVRLITGEGGQGKTRLAREFVLQTRQSNWIAGLTTISSASARKGPSNNGRELGKLLRKSSQPILVIADYAETDPEFVADLIDEMMSATALSNVRLLLLSRVAGAWWHNQVEALIALDAKVIKLEPLTNSSNERRELYNVAIQCLARHLRELSSSPISTDGPIDWPQIASHLALNVPDLSDPKLDNALTLHITALTDLLNLASGELPQRLGTSAESDLVAHEWAYMRRAAVRRRLLDQGVISTLADPDECMREAWQALESAVAGAILLGPCNLVEAHGVGRMASRDRPLDVLSWLSSLYPPPVGAEGIGAIQPDRLAELLLGRILVTKPALLAQIAALTNGIDKTISVLFTLLHTAAHTQFASIAEQTKDLVATSGEFSRAAHILTFTIAQAASQQGDTVAPGILDLITTRLQSILAVKNASSGVVAVDDTRATLLASTQIVSLRPYRNLENANPRALNVLLRNAMTILDYHEPQISDLGPMRIAMGQGERQLALGELTDENVYLWYAQAYPALLKIAYSIVGEVDAQDVVQSVFVNLYSRRGQIGAVTRPLGYLRQMVVNASRSYVRGRERESAYDFVGTAFAADFREAAYDHADEAVASYYWQLANDFAEYDYPGELFDGTYIPLMVEADLLEDVVLARIERAAVADAWRTLSESQQSAIWMHYFEGASVRQIAKRAKISRAMATKNLEQGIAALREALYS